MRVDAAFSFVKRAIECGRPAHGYLIAGPVRGAGMDLAVKILQLLFCRAEPLPGRPCGACDACRRVAERTAADVHWIFPEKKTRVISAEQIRDRLLAQIAQTSLAGGWKAGVLAGADRLNDSSANAFLKTLEEPPDKTLFLLLTDAPHAILPTILSRCQRIDLTAERGLAEPWKSRVLETLAGPHFRSPLERMASAAALTAVLADLKAEAERRVKEESAREAAALNEEDGVFDAKVSARYREMREELFLAVTDWFRDLLILRAGGDDAPVVNRPFLALLRERAGRLTLDQALANLTALDECAARLERNLPEESQLAYTIDRMSHGV